MATAIRTIPTLYGKEAESFAHEAEQVEANPHTVDFRHEAKVVRNYLRSIKF